MDHVVYVVDDDPLVQEAWSCCPWPTPQPVACSNYFPLPHPYS